MKIYDVIWGSVVIDDEDAVKIIKHSSMQRLKGIWISTHGYLFNLLRNATRYEHCLGVYLLLNKYKATKKEQIAGLIHDVSHTALSHVSTYAMQGKYSGKEFHEIQQDKFIQQSGLSKLLKNLGYETNDILHTDKFTLLENDLPDICADRIDYALRDALHLQILSRQQVDKILEGLIVYKGEFVFSNEDSAFLYAFNFYILNLMFYGSPAEAHFNNNYGSLVKRAIEKGILKEEDWYTDDIKVTDKLKNSKDKEIINWLGKYNNKMVITEDHNNPDIVFPKKIRVVDPKVLVHNKLVRLSEINEGYCKLINDYKETHQKHELPVKVVYKD